MSKIQTKYIADLAITNAKIANNTIDLVNKTTGILPVGLGGTGQNSYADGQLLIGNSAGGSVVKTTLTQGSNITIVNGNGSIVVNGPSASIPLPANAGGTGVSSPTIHGILVAQGSATMTSLVGGAGTILQGNGSSADPTFTATPTLGINGTSTGTLAFATSTGGGASVIIQNLATTVAWNFNLPTSAGSPGQVLTSQGGSTTSMTWANAITGASYRAGSQTISNNTSSQAVSFSSTLGTTAYGLTVTMVNVTDTNPQYQPVIVTSISATGFTAKWNSPTDSANYVLHYHAILNN